MGNNIDKASANRGYLYILIIFNIGFLINHVANGVSPYTVLITNLFLLILRLIMLYNDSRVDNLEAVSPFAKKVDKLAGRING